jgi:hypothetical protein
MPGGDGVPGDDVDAKERPRDDYAAAVDGAERYLPIPAFPNQPCRGPRTGKLLWLQRNPSCAACPDRALPCYALLRPLRDAACLAGLVALCAAGRVIGGRVRAASASPLVCRPQ